MGGLRIKARDIGPKRAFSLYAEPSSSACLMRVIQDHVIEKVGFLDLYFGLLALCTDKLSDKLKVPAAESVAYMYAKADKAVHACLTALSSAITIAGAGRI